MLPVCPGYSLQKHSLPCSSLKKWGRKHPNKNQISSVHDTFTCEENSILGLFRTVKPPPPATIVSAWFQTNPSFLFRASRETLQRRRQDWTSQHLWVTWGLTFQVPQQQWLVNVLLNTFLGMILFSFCHPVACGVPLSHCTGPGVEPASWCWRNATYSVAPQRELQDGSVVLCLVVLFAGCFSFVCFCWVFLFLFFCFFVFCFF